MPYLEGIGPPGGLLIEQVQQISSVFLGACHLLKEEIPTL